MNRIIVRIKKSEFLTNAATVFSGSLLSQIIPILAAPFLARIYSPLNYGILAIYAGVAGIIGIISTFQYHNAILLPKEEDDSIALMRLCVRNTIITSTLSLVAILLAGKPFMVLINASTAWKWLPFVPLSVLCIGFNIVFTSLATRKKLFRVVSINRIISSIVTVAISFSLGIIYENEIGLILGLIGGQIISGLILAVMISRAIDLKISSVFRFSKLSEVKRKYVNFPKFSLPTDLLNNFTNQIPVFMINVFAGPAFTGIFNMCNRLLSLPQVFISSAFSEVFRQRASHDYNHKGSFRPIFIKTARTLAILCILPFFFILLFGPDLFAIFLGEKWREAGELARIMAPLFVLRFINAPLSYILYLLGKLKFDLSMTVYLNVSTIIILYFGLTYTSVYSALFFFVLNYSLTYLFMIYKSFQFSKITNPHYAPV